MSHAREFTCRYLFRGNIELQAGMHIGGGRVPMTPTDSPVVRTPEGKPYIPGSSMKGSFRASVERLCQSVGSKETWSCALDARSECVGAAGEVQKSFLQNRREKQWTEDEMIQQLEDNLCTTCRLFGSQFVASKILFSDLYLRNDEGEGFIQIRDGVAIDRDTDGAVDGLKYDYEVVSATQTFDLMIQLNQPTGMDLALTCLGLTEFISGFGYVGGLRSRGLGRCILKNLEVFFLDLKVGDVAKRAELLKKYLLGTKPEDKFTAVRNVEQFLQDQIDQIFLVPAR